MATPNTPGQAMAAGASKQLPGGYNPQQAQGLLQLRKFLTDNYFGEGSTPKEEGAKELLKEISDGVWTVFPYMDKGVVFVVGRPGKGAPGEVCMYAAPGAKVANATKQFMQDVWVHTSHKKLTMHTNDPNVARLAKLVGAHLEGTKDLHINGKSLPMQVWAVERPKNER